jgi:hypothetical protein
MSEPAGLSCPVCGIGVVADISFDLDASRRGGATPHQGAETTELTTYSCGHKVPGHSLASADADVLDVERRRSEDTVQPTP